MLVVLLLTQLHKAWDYRHVLSHPARLVVLTLEVEISLALEGARNISKELQTYSTGKTSK